LAKKVAIFDLDGTLLDTLTDLRESLKAALWRFDFPADFDDQSFKMMIGNGLARLIGRALPAGSAKDEALIEKIRLAFKKEYALRLRQETKPYPEISELLDRLSYLGFDMAVFSNKDEDNAKKLVDHFFPNRFAFCFGATAERPIKPDPAGGLELARRLGLDPTEILYLGDSEVDMQTAANCGFIPVGVAWGFRDVEVLRESGAKFIVKTPLEFLNVVEKTHGSEA
jgi:phosphoglycolate phosphatase